MSGRAFKSSYRAFSGTRPSSGKSLVYATTHKQQDFSFFSSFDVLCGHQPEDAIQTASKIKAFSKHIPLVGYYTVARKGTSEGTAFLQLSYLH